MYLTKLILFVQKHAWFDTMAKWRKSNSKMKRVTIILVLGMILQWVETKSMMPFTIPKIWYSFISIGKYLYPTFSLLEGEEISGLVVNFNIHIDNNDNWILSVQNYWNLYLSKDEFYFSVPGIKINPYMRWKKKLLKPGWKFKN